MIATISREITAARREFKTPIYLGGELVTSELPTRANPNHPLQRSSRRPFKSLLRLNDGLELAGYCNIKCFDHSGELLWFADSGAPINFLHVDPDDNLYVTSSGSWISYPNTFSQINILTKYNSAGEVAWAIPAQKIASGFSFYTEQAMGVGTNSNGDVYLAWQSVFNDPTQNRGKIYKYDSEGNFLTSFQINGFLDIRANRLRVGPSDEVVVQRGSGSGTGGGIVRFEGDVYDWETSSSSLTQPSGTVSWAGLGIDGSGNIFAGGAKAHPTLSSTIFQRLSSVPVLLNTYLSNTSGDIRGLALSGSVALVTGGLTTAHTISKASGTCIGANSSGDYATTHPVSGPADRVKFFNSSDVLQWEDPWGGSINLGNNIRDVAVTSDRVYVAGTRFRF